MVEVVSARIDEEIRQRMKRFPHVNWSEAMREGILRRIEEEERRRRTVDPERIREAMRVMEEIRTKPAPGWDSTEEIRKWRRLRR